MRTLLVGLVVVAIGACAPDEPSTATSTAASTSSNALTTNALSQNGMFQNGMFQNGMFQNGMFQNGLYQYALYQDGVLQNGLWKNEVWKNSPAAREILRTNPYTRQVLQYIYGCAMEPGQSVILDPGEQPPDGPPGDSKLVELKGEIGLWPDWGKESGTCGLSCQRWVSACVFARTNAYGVKVELSMRVPDDDDVPERIKKALKVHRDADPSRDEVKLYPLREGAFYGNLFQTTPEDGFAKIAPVFYACAGKGSNIPQITKRFCSSQGADGPITVVGTCVPPDELPTLPSACARLSPAAGAHGATTEDSGALHHCFTSTKLEEQTDDTKYTEVITVYVKDLISVCGDSVCDETTENTASCPSDCHPDSRARTIPLSISSHYGQGYYGDASSAVPLWELSALGPDDKLTVLANQVMEPVSGDGFNVLVQYDEDHNYLWGRRFGSLPNSFPGGVAVANDRSIIASGYVAFAVPTHYIWVMKWNPPDNSTTPPTPPSLKWTVTSSGPGFAATSIAPVVDHQGNVVVVGGFVGEIHIGNLMLKSDDSQGHVFVMKISPDGKPLWATRVGQGATFQRALAVDRHGDILVTQASHAKEPGLLKLSGEDGSQIPGWQRRGLHQAVVSDGNGDVYATGSLSSVEPWNYYLSADTYDFEIPPGAGLGDFFVVKYRGSDAAVLAVYIPPDVLLHAQDEPVRLVRWAV